MNIFLRELKANRRSLIIWAVSAFLLILAGMSKYAGFSGSGEINKIFETLPKAAKAVFGLGTFDLGKAEDFYGLMYFYILLLTGAHAVLLGAGIISKEERDRTAEFLMAKPVARPGILTAKLSAALVNIVAVNLVTYASSVLFVGYYSKWAADQAALLKMSLGLLFFQLIFLMLGFMLAASTKNIKASSSVGTSVLMITFILSVVIDITENVDWLSYLTPFKYFTAVSVIYEGGPNIGFIALALALSAVFGVIAYRKFQTRDLKI